MSNSQSGFECKKFGRLKSQRSYAFFSYWLSARTWKTQVQFLFLPECFSSQVEVFYAASDLWGRVWSKMWKQNFGIVISMQTDVMFLVPPGSCSWLTSACVQKSYDTQQSLNLTLGPFFWVSCPSLEGDDQWKEMVLGPLLAIFFFLSAIKHSGVLGHSYLPGNQSHD